MDLGGFPVHFGEEASVSFALDFERLMKGLRCLKASSFCCFLLINCEMQLFD